MSGLAARVHDALIDRNPLESEKRVKEAVAGALQEFDPSATVKVTSYFNHTFAPDMVMRWGKAERRVFLRFTDNVPELAHDIDLLGPVDPLVFGLSTPDADAATKNRLHERAVKTETWFTEPAAIDALTTPKSPAPTDRMLRNSLAHGGRGALVGPAAASRLAEQVNAGFTSAAAGTLTGTREALDTISTYFRDDQARKLGRVIQAVWEGSGARLDQYPGDADLGEQVGDLSLLYLLQFMDTDDSVFWRGVGRGITLDQIVSLASLSSQDNFQHIVNANIDVLHARACQVLDAPASLFDDADARPFRWGVALPLRDTPPAVTLTGPAFKAFLTRSKELLEPRLRDAADGIPVPTFVCRAVAGNLTHVDVSVGDKRVAVRDESGGTRFLEDLTAQLAGARVDKATVHTSSGRVTVDFTRRTGTGPTKTDNLAADLLDATVGLLIDLDPSARDALSTFLAVGDRDTSLPGQGMLAFEADDESEGDHTDDAEPDERTGLETDPGPG